MFNTGLVALKGFDEDLTLTEDMSGRLDATEVNSRKVGDKKAEVIQVQC